MKKNTIQKTLAKQDSETLQRAGTASMPWRHAVVHASTIQQVHDKQTQGDKINFA